MVIGGTLVTVLLGLAGMLLGLSVVVQVMQECWKYLFNTKADAYQRALIAFLGPFAQRLLQPGVLPDLQVNGPFQLWRSRPQGRLLPMEKDTLVGALERTSAPWVLRTLEALRLEDTLAPGDEAKCFSPAFKSLVDQLSMVGRAAPGYAVAVEVLRFLETWGVTKQEGEGETRKVICVDTPIDASKLVTAFREQFLPHITEAEKNFPQLALNFDYIYRRRNTVLTFVFALIVTIIVDVPVSTLYDRARAMTPEQAVALAEASRQAYDSLTAITSQPPDTTARDSAKAKSDQERAERLKAISVGVLDKLDSLAGVKPSEALRSMEVKPLLAELSKRLKDLWRDGWTAMLNYLLGCLATALLISFGAPFWNDIAGSLLRLQKSPPRQDDPPAKATGGAT